MGNLVKFKDFRPSQFDSRGLGSRGQEDWYVVPVMLTRDSDTLETSNFYTALELLGGESDTVSVHRFHHWGCGYFEIIVTAPSHIDTVTDISRSLSNYALLDEEDFVRRDSEENDRVYADILEHKFARTIEDTLNIHLPNYDNLYSLFTYLMDRENVYFENNWVDVDAITHRVSFEDLYECQISFKCSPEIYETLDHYKVARSGITVIDNTTDNPFKLPQHVLNALDPRQVTLL